MPWHRSKSNPCKVYNARHEEVCICQTPEEAARVVAEANGQPLQPIPGHAPEVAGPMNFVAEDDCCNPRLVKALRSGAARESWVCPKCGCTWLAVTEPEKQLTVWSPETYVAIW